MNNVNKTIIQNLKKHSTGTTPQGVFKPTRQSVSAKFKQTPPPPPPKTVYNPGTALVRSLVVSNKWVSRLFYFSLAFLAMVIVFSSLIMFNSAIPPDGKIVFPFF